MQCIVKFTPIYELGQSEGYLYISSCFLDDLHGEKRLTFIFGPKKKHLTVTKRRRFYHNGRYRRRKFMDSYPTQKRKIWVRIRIQLVFLLFCLFYFYLIFGMNVQFCIKILGLGLGSGPNIASISLLFFNYQIPTAVPAL